MPHILFKAPKWELKSDKQQKKVTITSKQQLKLGKRLK